MANEKRGLKTKVVMSRMSEREYGELKRYALREDIPGLGTALRKAALLTIRFGTIRRKPLK